VDFRNCASAINRIESDNDASQLLLMRNRPGYSKIVQQHRMGSA
jgi:hypothetical protein